MLNSIRIYIIFFMFLLIITVLFHFANSTTFYDFITPTNYNFISSYYGYRELYGISNFHNGIDFLAPQGSDIYASSSGIIIYASFMQDGFGNTIIIEHSNNIKTLYCHVDENFIVKIGDFVNQGEIIGKVGPKYLSNGIQNGNTTGPHLHFSIYKDNQTVDPLEYIKK